MKRYAGVPIPIIFQALRLTEDGKVVWNARPENHFATVSAFKRFNTLFKDKEYGYETGGYRSGSIVINGKNKRLLYHVAKWVLAYGCYPVGIIDHLDGNGLNNAIENLRDCTRTLNSRNAKKRMDNTSGVNGVYWNKRDKCWRAQGFITIDGKLINKWLGDFSSLTEATACRAEWELTLGCSERHGK